MMVGSPSRTEHEKLGPRIEAELIAQVVLIEASLQDSFQKLVRELLSLQESRKQRKRGCTEDCNSARSACG
jgi:hypothetical protein